MARKATPKTVRDSNGVAVAVIAKNSNGEGSVYLAAGPQRWHATYTDPVTGKRREATAKTPAEAEARRAEKLAELTAKADVERVKGRKPTSYPSSAVTAVAEQVAAWKGLDVTDALPIARRMLDDQHAQVMQSYDPGVAAATRALEQLK